jgi:hypothetical protein
MLRDAMPSRTSSNKCPGILFIYVLGLLTEVPRIGASRPVSELIFAENKLFIGFVSQNVYCLRKFTLTGGGTASPVRRR